MGLELVFNILSTLVLHLLTIQCEKLEIASREMNLYLIKALCIVEISHATCDGRKKE